jgi:uncharacterized protein YjbI with pentapeptide repeats
MSGRKEYDWAKAILAIASTSSTDLNEVAAAADLDPKDGDLSDVDFSDIDLSGQDLSGWDLRHANLTNARLKGADLRHAVVDPRELIQAAHWEKANLDDELREATLSLNNLLMQNINELQFSVRTANCLKNYNCNLIGDLVQMTEAETIRIPNWGRKSLNEVKEWLAQKGLQLGMKLPNWRRLAQTKL